jgi:preprotein translocase subunit YajC
VFLISDAYAAGEATAAAGAGDITSTITGFLPLILVFIVFFFFMQRPQMKRQKELKAMLEALAKGDEVVTSGGLLGKVTALSDSSIGLQISENVEIQLQRNAVIQVLPKGTLKLSGPVKLSKS